MTNLASKPRDVNVRIPSLLSLSHPPPPPPKSPSISSGSDWSLTIVRIVGKVLFDVRSFSYTLWYFGIPYSEISLAKSVPHTGRTKLILFLVYCNTRWTLEYFSNILLLEFKICRSVWFNLSFTTWDNVFSHWSLADLGNSSQLIFLERVRRNLWIPVGFELATLLIFSSLCYRDTEKLLSGRLWKTLNRFHHISLVVANSANAYNYRNNFKSK